MVRIIPLILGLCFTQITKASEAKKESSEKTSCENISQLDPSIIEQILTGVNFDQNADYSYLTHTPPHLRDFTGFSDSSFEADSDQESEDGGRSFFPWQSSQLSDSDFAIQDMRHAVLGLPNLGNTCYLNSVLTLIATTKLQKVLNSNATLPRGSTDQETLDHLLLKKALNPLISGMTNQITPGHTKRVQENFVLLKRLFSPSLEGSLNIQHDPTEIYTKIMDALGSEQNHAEAMTGETVKKDGRDEVTFHRMSNKFLEVPITHGSKLSTHLRRLFQEGVTQVENSDGTTSTFRKQLGLISAPETLLLRLGRMSYLGDGAKKTKSVFIPTHMTLKVYQKSKREFNLRHLKKVPYHLKTIIAHEGTSMHGGHYVTYSFVRKKKRLSIIKYNDNQVTQVPRSHLPQIYKDAYIVAYER